jgi:hypothetical protein
MVRRGGPFFLRAVGKKEWHPLQRGCHFFLKYIVVELNLLS